MAIRSILVDLKTGAPADQEKRSHKTVKWRSSFPGSLTVRGVASEYAKAIWYLQDNVPVEVLGAKGEFFRIRYGKHQQGYVESRFLRRCYGGR